MKEIQKINFTTKIFPLFSGMSMDLLFWAAINMIFLTTVKGLNASQISVMTSISSLAAIVIYPVAVKIIKKIGNINSVRLGTILLLIGASLLTFSKAFLLIIFGKVAYEISFIFKNMDNVVLRKNLKYMNKTDDFIKIQGKATFFYSFLTLIIAFISGFIFNINNYLPMILCTIICVIDVILSFCLYECQGENIKEEKTKNKMSMSKIIMLIIILYGLTFAVINLGQSNSQLFIQYELNSYLKIDTIAIILSVILTLSRLVRFASNFLFNKFYNVKNSKLLYTISSLLALAYVLLIMGGLIPVKILNIVLMTIGFCIFLGVRDPFLNYTKTFLLNNCHEEYHQNAMAYLTTSQQIGNFVVSGIIALILLKASIMYVMIFLLLVAIFDIFLVKKIYSTVEK